MTPPPPAGTLAYDVTRLRAALRDLGRAMLDVLRPAGLRRAVLAADQERASQDYAPGSVLLWRADMANPPGWVDALWPLPSRVPGDPFRYIVRDGFTVCECGDQPAHVYSTTGLCPVNGPRRSWRGIPPPPPPSSPWRNEG